MAATLDRILYLDVDGVINSQEFARRATGTYSPGGGIWGIDDEAVARLASIVTRADASIVISSTWRKFHDYMAILMTALRAHGIADRVIGITPIAHLPRGGEIALWMEQNGTPDRFVILDDDTSNMEQFGERYIQTYMDDGLQDEHVERAVRLLTQ